MPYLALDTSTEYLSLAISTAEGIVARDWPAGQKHAEMILPALASLLQECQLSMEDIEGVAFGNGPGSFTGLRIAAGITQGLAFARNVPVLGVSTLAALAEGCHADQVYVCLDARMNQVYCAAYRKEADVWQTIIEPCLSDPDSIPLPDGSNWLGAGSGFAAYGETLRQRLGTQLNGANAERFPHAKDILKLALADFSAGKGLAAQDAELVYLRNKVALKTHERIKKMKVRDLNASDIPQLMALDAATNSHPWDISHWQHSLKADVCLGIDGSTELAAFAVAMKMVDEAELLLIAVQPNLQGKGVGQIIFNSLTQKLTKNGAQSLFLEVRESNSKARRFYESAGFAETGIRPAYYPAACGAGREDALIFAMMMSKA